MVGDDKSDIAEETRLGCIASIPDPKMKEQVWNEFTDPHSPRSLSEKEAEMNQFASFEQMDLIRPYQEKFFSNLAEMYKQNSYKWFEAYFHSLLPREREINESDIAKLRAIKDQYLQSPEGKKASRNNGFTKTLDGGIEAMLRSKKLRDFAKAKSTPKTTKPAPKVTAKQEPEVLTDAQIQQKRIQAAIQTEQDILDEQRRKALMAQMEKDNDSIDEIKIGGKKSIFGNDEEDD